MSTTPTAEQIAKVTANLANIQAINDYAYDGPTLNGIVTQAFASIEQQDTSSLAGTIALNILEGAFWGIGGAVGAGGEGLAAAAGFIASFSSGMAAAWAGDGTVQDLLADEADTWTFLGNAQVAYDKQITGYAHTLKHGSATEIATTWAKSFSYGGKTSTISDLATIDIPTEGSDDSFYTLVDAFQAGIRTALWQHLLKQYFQITLWETGSPEVVSGSETVQPLDWAKGYYEANPASHLTWQWQNGRGCGAQTGWVMTEYTIGTQPSEYHDNDLPTAACKLLFKDTIPSDVINANGAMTREEVFALSIQHGTWAPVYSYPSGMGAVAPPALSPGYLRAMKEGKTLTALVQAEGREAVQARVLAQAKADPYFRYNLKMRPRPTLEAFLGVRIAEAINLQVVVEDPITFGLVVPAKE